MTSSKPLVLCLSGHDPVGGAGIHADIEAVAANGGHAISLITALTVQDTAQVQRVQSVPAVLLAQQLQTVLADCTPAAVKIGLLGEAAQIPVIVEAIAALQIQIPLVLDPVLRAGGGATLAGTQTIVAMQTQLFPCVTVLTPNAAEARRLAPQAGTDADRAQVLLRQGCRNILVTGGDEAGAEVCNIWYRDGAAPQHYRWPRLAETFHGAGCTLAAALATRLARGEAMPEAILQAQRYTQTSLQAALSVGRGRRIPGRLP
ncbi:MAG: bifunctional hydroxymethylpyrimidine kinase/phosphomethylpyrimidine kinase [Stenotrophobium sp.]